MYIITEKYAKCKQAEVNAEVPADLEVVHCRSKPNHAAVVADVDDSDNDDGEVDGSSGYGDGVCS